MQLFKKEGSRYISQVAIVSMVFGFCAGVVGQIVSDVYINPWELDYDVSDPTNQDLSFDIPELKSVKKFIGIQQDFEVNKSVNKITPAIAGIYSKKAAGSGILNQIYLPGELLSSAVILTADGWLASYNPALTAAKKEQLAVVTGNKTYAVSDLIADATTGAVFIKLGGVNNLPVATLGDSDETAAGQIGIAVNYLGETAVISNLNPDYLPLDSAGSLVQPSERYGKLLMLSGALKNSFLASPLINLEGEVVGLIKETGDAKKLALAVPINQLRAVVSDMLRTNKIKRPYLGVTYIDLSHAVGLNLDFAKDRNRGALVYQNPKAKSPAALAGIKPDDIIVSAEGQQLDEKSSLSEIILQYRIGDTLTLEILRDNKIISVKVTLTEIP